MKKLVLMFVFLCITGSAMAGVKYINPYTRSDGTYVNGHYRDTSNDGNPYNNANYLGYNERRGERRTTGTSYYDSGVYDNKNSINKRSLFYIGN